MNAPLLEIKDLEVHYETYEGTLRVLDGVGFIVGKKEKIGLIGETGCGKTTLMKSIMRILPSNARVPNGEIIFKGRNLLEMSSREIQKLRRHNISMVFQDPTGALNPVFKIGDQLIDVAKYSSDRDLTKEEMKAECMSVLREVALPDQERIMENYPVQLSGGMRQRVCIAMALLAHDDLLIADEPGTSLDVTIKDQILRLLNELTQKRETSVILVSHALGTVKGLTDRIYVMYAGSIMEVGKTTDVFSDPMHPYTRGLIAAVPKLTGGGISNGIRGRIPEYLNPPIGCRFSPRCDFAKSICKKKQPDIFDFGNDRKIACYLYGR